MLLAEWLLRDHDRPLRCRMPVWVWDLYQRKRLGIDGRRVRDKERKDLSQLGLWQLLLNGRLLWKFDRPLRRRMPEQVRYLQQRKRQYLD